MRPSRSRLLPVVVSVVPLVLLAAALADTDSDARRRHGMRAATRGHPQRVVRRHIISLGRSVRGRRIRAVVLGDPRTPRPLLVVGCIHGNEPAGIAVAWRLASLRPPRARAVWIVPDLNPDGRVAGRRQNADGVDLNRNFPHRWRPLGAPGDQQYSGPRPLSEPESRIAHRLILRIRPAITIWFHQPLGVTDRSGGEAGPERRFAALSALPLRRLPRYPGSAAGWQDHSLTRTAAFVVELPPGRPSTRAITRWALAALGAYGATR